jgi:addiction module HigA family antidote
MAKENQYFPQSLPHPGETLAEKLEEMDMTSSEFAECTGITRKIINDILNGKCDITYDIAVKFADITRIPVHFWMNNQRHYNEFMERKNLKKTVRLQPV